jgi:hypothetical protein
MYSLIALLAGAAAKLYDDLEDNNFLQKFRNNTLMEFSPESWDKINGLSFSPKKMDNVGSDSSFCVIIKIWFKQNYGNNANIDKFLNINIQELLKKYSVKVKSIKPEY